MPKARRQIAPTFTWEGRAFSVDEYTREARVSGLLVPKDGEIVLRTLRPGTRARRALYLLFGGQVGHLDPGGRGGAGA